MTAPRLLVHTCTLPIRWGDMDALGHVNNTVYFQYMEQARSDWIYRGDHQGGGGGAYDPGQTSVIVNANCEFVAPLAFPADVTVRMFLTHPGRSSVGSLYEIASAGCIHATGAAKMVWIDAATGRSSPVPERIIAPLRALTG